MSNSNYSIGLQRLKPVHTAYGAICMPIRKLLMHWSWAQDVNGRDRDIYNFSRDETLVRLETESSRPRPQPWLFARQIIIVVLLEFCYHFSSSLSSSTSGMMHIGASPFLTCRRKMKNIWSPWSQYSA